MPRCIKCQDFLPPDMCEDVANGHKCVYCSRGVNTVVMNNVEITKENAILDYKIFMENLAKNPNVKELAKLGDFIGEQNIIITPKA